MRSRKKGFNSRKEGVNPRVKEKGTREAGFEPRRIRRNSRDQSANPRESGWTCIRIGADILGGLVDATMLHLHNPSQRFVEGYKQCFRNN